MSMIFRFRMLNGENDYFVREYEVPYDMSLAEFNDFICDEMRFDRGSITSFFTSNALWEKEREFTREDMSAPGSGDDDEVPLPMDRIALGQVVRHNRDRLIFVFDVFADRSMFIELMGAKERENARDYPRITLARGDAPKQFDAGSESFIFDDMLSEFDDMESYETEYDNDF